MEVENDTRIADINDKFRKSTVVGLMLTSGILGLCNANEIVERVRGFNSFNESNDPYGEHDFGVLRVGGEKIFWKIDYYDEDRKYGKDPLDPTCNRVLTIMLASEY